LFASSKSLAAVGVVAVFRWYALAVLLASPGLVLVACQAQQPVQEGPEREEEQPRSNLPSQARGVAVDRIVYVSSEGNLFTIQADGSNAQQLTGDIRVRSTGGFLAQSLNFSSLYTWPTWSPDGSKLAASRLRVSADQAEVSIQVIDTATGRTRTVYRNDPSMFALVAQTAPHYLYWSPDSRSLAFIATAPQGLTLFVTDMEAPDSLATVQVGAPMYLHWARDGNSFLLHVGDDVKLVQKPFGTASRDLVYDTVGFRAPAISPDGRWMAYTSAAGSLVVAETANPSQMRLLLEVGNLAAFMWSPDGRELAVVDQEDPNSAIFQRLRIVSADGGIIRTMAEEPLVAFYWSPDGQRIAWVAVDRERQALEWKVAPRSGGAVRQLFRFQPSSEVRVMLNFFDQFAYSHSPWSPDGTRLVVAGTSAPTLSRRNGQTPTGDRIFVLDAAGAAAPREIASGTLAFWSWN
jgi:TolB protein